MRLFEIFDSSMYFHVRHLKDVLKIIVFQAYFFAQYSCHTLLFVFDFEMAMFKYNSSTYQHKRGRVIDGEPSSANAVRGSRFVVRSSSTRTEAIELGHSFTSGAER
jgi:hypothetical protein